MRAVYAGRPLKHCHTLPSSGETWNKGQTFILYDGEKSENNIEKRSHLKQKESGVQREAVFIASCFKRCDHRVSLCVFIQQQQTTLCRFTEVYIDTSISTNVSMSTFPSPFV